MSSAPNQQNNNFGSQPAGTQNNNPFTNDLKGEFSSNFGGTTNNFGTGTNAVSQIFKDGSFGGSNNTKYYIAAGLIVLFGAIGYWMMGSDDTTVTDPDVAVDDASLAEKKEAQTEPEAAKPAAEAKTETPAAETAAATEQAPPAAAGNIQLTSPESGASMPYDETQGSAQFTWNGGPGTIVFSRHSSMSPEVMRIKVSGQSYSFHRPWPGQWYWKVETEAGASEVRSFSVQAPVRRNISLTAPTSGATVAGTGGAVTWTQDSGVAYYRVELNQSDDWSNPQFKFSSSGSQLQLNGVPAGAYNMRLGAFSEVSGRWEYTSPIKVTVQ
jgi:hypothetical protein